MPDEISISKYRKLTVELWRRTNSDRIDWSSSLMGDGFDAGIGHATINLSEVPNGATIDYQVNIYSNSFTISDTFTDVTIADRGAVNVEDFDTYFDLMRELYTRVKRKVEGADVVLDQVLKDLGLD